MGEAKSEKTQNELRKRQKLKVQLNEQDIRTVMNTAAGRRFVWRIIDGMAGLHDVSFACSNATFFNEGKRAVAQELMREVQRVASSHYVHMLGEALSEQHEDRLQSELAKGAAKRESEDA